MRRLGLALVLFSIVFAAAAGSAAAAPVEERLSMDHTYGMDAVDGWVSWKNDGDRQKLWHSGGIVQLARPYSRVLGTDAEGQVVALESSCIGCRIVQRVLPDGPLSALPRRATRSVDEDRGTLAYVRGDGRAYVLRRGARHVQRLAPVNVWKVLLAGHRLLYASGDGSGTTEFGLVDLAHGARPPRVLVHDDDRDEECSCFDSYVDEHSLELDGHFAYWAETILSGLQEGDTQAITSKILRIDLAARHPVVESFSPQRSVETFAFTRGKIFYSSRGALGEENGVWRVTDPQWQPTNRRVPVQG